MPPPVPYENNKGKKIRIKTKVSKESRHHVAFILNKLQIHFKVILFDVYESIFRLYESHFGISNYSQTMSSESTGTS